MLAKIRPVELDYSPAYFDIVSQRKSIPNLDIHKVFSPNDKFPRYHPASQLDPIREDTIVLPAVFR